MRPTPDAFKHPQTHEQVKARPGSGTAQGEALVALSEEQRRLLAVLQTKRDGMTMRQLQTKLSCPDGVVQPLLETLLECQLVARLNTVVPSYVYRYGGVDLQAD